MGQHAGTNSPTGGSTRRNENANGIFSKMVGKKSGSTCRNVSKTLPEIFSNGWVNIPEPASNIAENNYTKCNATRWVNMPGMVGQHKTEWWVNMERNLHLAFQANQQDRQIEMFIYGGLALLFQPFFKIALGRELWNIIDVTVAIGLLVSIFMNPKKSKH